MCSENPRQGPHQHATYLITIGIVTHWLEPPINNNTNNIIINHSITVWYHWFSKAYCYFTLIKYISYCKIYFNLVDYKSYCKIYFTLIEIHKLSLIQLYMYIYMKAHF